MSKLELQEKTLAASGVSFHESEDVLKLEPSLYERLGEKGFMELSTLFYDRVFDDQESKWFLNIFASSSKAEAIDNQFRFFVQTFGGPHLYRQKKGKYTRLVGRHANYSIGRQAADRWVEHMSAAMSEHSILMGDQEIHEKLFKYFRYTAHYIVVSSIYMRSDQLSGGTHIDPGRIW